MRFQQDCARVYEEETMLWFDWDFNEVEGVWDLIGVDRKGLRLRDLGERGKFDLERGREGEKGRERECGYGWERG